jgi:serine/threonine protein kinase
MLLSVSTSDASDPLDLYDALRMAGEEIDAGAFAARYPQHPQLARRIARLDALREELDGVFAPPSLRKTSWPKHVAGHDLGRLIGEGGMGAVFEAQAPDGRACAVKLLHERESLERFEREVQATSALAHPAIARVFAYGVEAGQPYLVTELVRGRSLKGMRLDEAEVSKLGRTLCSALDHAHGLGVVHRDIKPSNVMLGADGALKLIDFGLALHRDVSDETRTRSGVFLGSRNYAAPEQLRGDRSAIGPWTDVFGLGATLYELATGACPFDFPTFMARLDKAEQKAPPAKKHNPALSRRLDQALQKALAPDRKKRFSSAIAFSQALA